MPSDLRITCCVDADRRPSASAQDSDLLLQTLQFSCHALKGGFGVVQLLVRRVQVQLQPACCQPEAARTEQNQGSEGIGQVSILKHLCVGQSVHKLLHELAHTHRDFSFPQSMSFSTSLEHSLTASSGLMYRAGISSLIKRNSEAYRSSCGCDTST